MIAVPALTHCRVREAVWVLIIVNIIFVLPWLQVWPRGVKDRVTAFGVAGWGPVLLVAVQCA